MLVPATVKTHWTLACALYLLSTAICMREMPTGSWRLIHTGSWHKPVGFVSLPWAQRDPLSIDSWSSGDNMISTDVEKLEKKFGTGGKGNSLDRATRPGERGSFLQSCGLLAHVT